MNSNHLNDWLSKKQKQSLLMGILNVTPDSFSDGGHYFKKNSAVKHALKMVDEGADIIDIGGESTKPFSDPVSLDEELSRVLPVIEALRKETDVCISIDTTKSEVANQALKVGASIINDVSAMEFDKDMVDIALKFDCPIVLMHMKGVPKNMQENPQYSSLISDIISYLNTRIDFVISKGVDRKILNLRINQFNLSLLPLICYEIIYSGKLSNNQIKSLTKHKYLNAALFTKKMKVIGFD